jgi:hypothetical protein
MSPAPLVQIDPGRLDALEQLLELALKMPVPDDPSDEFDWVILLAHCKPRPPREPARALSPFLRSWPNLRTMRRFPPIRL